MAQLSITLAITLAPPAVILGNTNIAGLVRTGATFDEKREPVRGGLFCESLFGTDDIERRTLLGYLTMTRPVANPLATGHDDSPLSLLTRLTAEELFRVQTCDAFLVLAAVPSAPVRPGELISEERWYTLEEEGAPWFEVATSGEAIFNFLGALDLPTCLEQARDDLACSAGERRSRAAKRVELLERFIANGIDPSWLMMQYLLVLPPALRPAERQNQPSPSDLNDLYARVIARNQRLAHFLEIEAPEMIMRNETSELTRTTEALFANGRAGRTFSANPADGHDLYSLSDLLRDHKLDRDVARAFEGHRVTIDAGSQAEELTAILSAVGLSVAAC